MAQYEIVLPESKPETEWTMRLDRWAAGRGEVAPEWRFRVAPPGGVRRPLVPDVSNRRLRTLSDEELEIPPLAPNVDDKIAVYLQAGSSLVIVVDPQQRAVELHDAAQGGGSVRFQIRPVEGVELYGNATAERLILDGQQRLTSLWQVLQSDKPTQTMDDKGRPIQRSYYIDIEKAIGNGTSLDDAIFGVDESRTIRANFGRDIVLDLSMVEKEFEQFAFPCRQIMNSNEWELGLHKAYPAKFARYMEFREAVLNAFRGYLVPIIELKKETSKEAVCLVFEKVNTGGVPLSVFELVTATYAADGFNLRDDWYGGRDGGAGRHKGFLAHALLRDVEPTEFLQGLSLLDTHDLRRSERAAGKTGKELSAVSAKRERVLELPLEGFKKWAGPLTDGFLHADRFLRREGLYSAAFLPYRSQVIPLATVMVNLADRWLEPVIYEKLAEWFWCGVLSESYGGAVESRIALDMQQVLDWISDPSASEPSTVTSAGFQPTRLDTLRTRTSAAYRGIYILLQKHGTRDFFWKSKVVDLDRDEYKIDIHHIFPKQWCLEHDIPARVFNSIVNKTPISYKANRMIGGKAPFQYLAQLLNHAQVKMSEQQQDEILRSHLINPELLRADDFSGFYAARRSALLEMVAEAMRKPIVPDDERPAEDEIDADVDQGEEAVSA